MAKSKKMIACRTCNNPIAATAKVCPYCGAKNKKPIYKRGWFIALVVIVILGILGAIGEENKKPKETPKATIPVTAPIINENPAASEPTVPSATALVDGMRPEFKEAMDSYEAFYDEYCAFIKQYSANPTDLTLLSKYTDMLTKLADMDEKFEAWEENDLNSAELKYYLEVHSRIMAKLLDVAN